jgi:hypothetical protein
MNGSLEDAFDRKGDTENLASRFAIEIEANEE